MSKKKKNKGLSYPIGKWVIVRSSNEGLNFGKLLEADQTGCILKHARRIFWHDVPKAGPWYEGVSVSGLPEGSKISGKVSKKIILEDYSITMCSKKAIKNMRNYKSHEE